MNSWLSSFSKRTQRLLLCFLIIPWAVFAVVAFDLLPLSWRFDHWPQTLRTFAVAAFGLFVIADTIFAVWYWLASSKDDIRD